MTTQPDQQRDSIAMLPLIRGIFKTMRPHQWTKNGLIFLPIFFDQKFFILEKLLAVVIGFFILSLTASIVYLVNDIVDVESDRMHPKKRTRPIASGDVPVPYAVCAAVLLFCIVIPTSFLITPAFTATLLAYLVLHFFYAYRLKHVVILDVLSISAGFVLRIIAGVVIVQVDNFSPWLYVCTITLSLFLAVGKRRQEFLMLGENAGKVRPVFNDYSLALLDEMLRLAVLSTFMTYLLYTVEIDFEQFLIPNPGLLTVPFVLYALLRYLYLIYVREEGSAPDEVLLKDRPLQVTILLWGLLFMAILYLPRF